MTNENMTNRNQEDNSYRLSYNLVLYLQNRENMTLKQIGQLIGVSESFISRVANRQRNFTTKHLVDFEAALGRPVALLLLSTTPRDTIPSNMRKAYDLLVKLLENQSLQASQE